MTDKLLYTLTVLVWGTTWYAIKLQVGLAPAEVSIFYRFALSAALLFVFCKVRKLPIAFSKQEHFRLAVMGLGLFSTHYLFVFEASKYLVSGVVAVVFSTVSFLSIINNFVFFRTKPALTAIAGALLGVAGLSIFFMDEILASNQRPYFFYSIALCGIGSVVFSLGTTASKYLQQRNLEIVPTMAMAMFYGLVVMATYIMMKGSSLVLPTSTVYWGSQLYLVVFGSILAFFWYLRVVKSMGMEMAGYVTVLCPVLSLVVSAGMEGYQSSLYDLIGFILIAAGNMLVFMKRKGRFKSHGW